MKSQFINNKDQKYWESFYKRKLKFPTSSFAIWILPFIKGDLVDIGCGQGRDVHFFLSHKIKAGGIDESYEDDAVIKMDVVEYMKRADSPRSVYARFFWHAIDRKLQRQILKWTKEYIFIEARTTDDAKRPKVYEDHNRNFVDVAELVKDLKKAGFEIISLHEGTGFSRYKKEDPHLVRVIARKK